jgi:hypothetical protein
MVWTEESRNVQKREVKSNNSDREDCESSLFQEESSWKEGQALDRVPSKETRLRQILRPSHDIKPLQNSFAQRTFTKVTMLDEIIEMITNDGFWTIVSISKSCKRLLIYRDVTDSLLNAIWA